MFAGGGNVLGTIFVKVSYVSPGTFKSIEEVGVVSDTSLWTPVRTSQVP